jgi:hypothetical protein
MRPARRTSPKFRQSSNRKLRHFWLSVHSGCAGEQSRGRMNASA